MKTDEETLTATLFQIETIRLVSSVEVSDHFVDLRLEFVHFMKPMQHFYLIRHGETDWNVKLARLQGHTDIPLNSKGERQAQALQNLVSEFQFTKIVSSDLSRAHHTAKLMINSQLPIVTTPKLREVHLGVGEGMSWDEVEMELGSDFRSQWSSIHEDHIDIRFPQGESRREVITRVKSCLKEYLLAHPGERIAFVTHGFVIRTLVFHLKPMNQPFHVPNCAVVPFAFHEGEFSYQGPLTVDQLIQPRISD